MFNVIFYLECSLPVAPSNKEVGPDINRAIFTPTPVHDTEGTPSSNDTKSTGILSTDSTPISDGKTPDESKAYVCDDWGPVNKPAAHPPPLCVPTAPVHR